MTYPHIFDLGFYDAALAADYQEAKRLVEDALRPDRRRQINGSSRLGDRFTSEQCELITRIFDVTSTRRS
jgi:hypothetical protein